MNKYFSPGCALSLYKPELAEKTELLINRFEKIPYINCCCRINPELPDKTGKSVIINVCPGCDWRFSRLYEGIGTITLWEYLADKDIPLPDYGGRVMAVHDSCSVRGKETVYDAVRTLLRRMNITVAETECNRAKSICCGSSMYKKVSKEELKMISRKRTESMPAEETAVYCVSCMKYLHNGGGGKARHIIDLLFGEESAPEPSDPEVWQTKISEYIKKAVKFSP
ncbi:MAG: (Fe-S)-binding protein [Deferribacteraceae bacterium]|nr:(Fe-S)-binding protein [Deferribacteraceae bacterium]